MIKSQWTNLKNVRKAAKKTKKKTDKKSEENEKKQAQPEVDPQEVFRNFAYEKIKTVFDLTTINGDININVDNVFPLMKVLELDTKDETVMDMVRTACIETFGDMDPIEFDNAVVEQRRQKAEEPEIFEDEIRSAFNLIDADQDGMISLPDVYQLMMGLGEMLTDEELAEMIQSADTDEDGQISYKEFKRFLVGLTEEEENEGEPENDDQEEDEQDPEGSEQQEVTKENENEVNSTDVVPEETSAAEQTMESKPDESKEDEKQEEKPKKSLKEKRKSVLWGYTSQDKIKVEDLQKKASILEKNDTQQTVSKDEKREETSVETNDDLKDKEEKNEKLEENNDSTNNLSEDKEDDTSSIIAVTVKHLDSIKEEENSENQNGSSATSGIKQKKLYRPASSRLARARTNSSITVSESVIEDSGIGTTDSDLDITEGDGFTPRLASDKTRPSSSTSRVTSARSRLSSARSRLSSARSRAMESHQTESTSLDFGDELLDLDDDDVDDDEEKSDITDPDAFHSPPSARQISKMEKLTESHSYCEIVNENSRSGSPKLSYKTLEEYLPPYETEFTGLHRVKSSNTLRKINDIEQTLLKRQLTAPQLNMEAIRQANAIVKVKPKPNINGICTHLSIDLNIPFSEKTKITNYDSYMKRPKTAMSFNEARRKSLIRASSFTTGRLVEHSDNNVNVIDLSKTLASKATDFPENSTLSIYHHGYKSVGPLARVMSAYNKSKQNGRTVQFNSLSRQLEKGFISKTETPRKYSKSVTPTSCSRQNIITLEMPVQQNRPKCKRFSHLRGGPPEVHAWS